MRETDDYNERQYKRMLQMIEAYECRQIGVATLIDNVYGLIRALEGVSDEWRSSLLRKWGPLEEVYAVSLHQGKTDLDDCDRKEIEAALADLKEALEKRGPEGGSYTN